MVVTGMRTVTRNGDIEENARNRANACNAKTRAELRSRRRGSSGLSANDLAGVTAETVRHGN